MLAWWLFYPFWQYEGDGEDMVLSNCDGVMLCSFMVMVWGWSGECVMLDIECS